MAKQIIDPGFFVTSIELLYRMYDKTEDLMKEAYSIRSLYQGEVSSVEKAMCSVLFHCNEIRKIIEKQRCEVDEMRKIMDFPIGDNLLYAPQRYKSNGE